MALLTWGPHMGGKLKLSFFASKLSNLVKVLVVVGLPKAFTIIFINLETVDGFLKD